MNKDEFIKVAKEAGYSDEEIQDLINFHDETGIPFSDMPLMNRDVN